MKNKLHFKNAFALAMITIMAPCFGWAVALPSIQASNISFQVITQTGMRVSWTNGNGSNRIVLMNTANTFTDPFEGSDPAGNPSFNHQGQQVVYNGNDNWVTVESLRPSAQSQYWFRVYEYDRTGSKTRYCTLPGTNNPAATAFNPSIPSAPLCGTKTVGVGGDYPTLTAAALDINNNVLCGALDLVLTDATYPNETLPIQLNYNTGSSATNTITIKPGPGVSPVITSTTNGEIFLFYGCDHVIIDGSNQPAGTGKNLTLSNTNTAGVYNCLINLIYNGTRGATNCTIKNCILTGNPALFNSFGIATSTGGGNFQNLSIINNTIKNARIGIQFLGTAGNTNENGIISDNIIGDLNEPITQGGILMSYSDNTLITRNDIFGNAGGNPNEFQYGIFLRAGSTNTKIMRNKIHDFYYNGTNSEAGWGIYYNAEASSPTEISNNLIYNFKGDGDLVTMTHPEFISNIPSGIVIMSGGNLQIYNNTINMTGSVLGQTSLSALYEGGSSCISINTSVTNLNIRNNIFKNSMKGIILPNANKTYGIISFSAANTLGIIDYNDYFIDGVNPNIGYLSGDLTTLAQWQAATGQDAHAVTADPGFASDIDLHPGLSGPNNKGISTGITTDFADVTRQDPPDMGAYEFSLLASITTKAASGISLSGATLNGSVNANNESAAVTFEYGPTTSYGTSVAGTPNTATGSVSTDVSTTLTGLLPNATYHFRVNANTPAGMINGADLTFITSQTPIGVVTPTAGQFGLYPIPSNGLFTATMAWPKAERFILRIYNSLGSLIYEKKDILTDKEAKQQIDLRNAPSGIYTVSFTSGNTRVIRKMVIKHP